MTTGLGSLRGDQDINLTTHDGVGLATTVWRAGRDPAPVVIIRTPYGRAEQEAEARVLNSHGMHVVAQDVRGSGASEGTASMFAEAADGAVLATWAAGRAWCDGRIAAIGSSYLGFTALATAAAAEVPVAGLAIRIYGSDRRSSWFPGGALNLELALPWSIARARNLSGDEIESLLIEQPEWLRAAYRHLPLSQADVVHGGMEVPMFQEWLAYPKDHPHWDPLDYSSWLATTPIPVLQVGGWHDYHLPPMLQDFQRRREHSLPADLVVGPWTHSSLDEDLVHATTARWLERTFASSGQTDTPAESRVRFFVGPDGGWRESQTWPPTSTGIRAWSLCGARLTESDPDDMASFARSYVYDPDDPTPAQGGSTIAPPPIGGVVDNAEREARDDVLCYTTEPMAEVVTVLGGRVVLNVVSDNPNFDLHVRLCDVDPGGRSWNITDGFLRLPLADPGTKPSAAHGLATTHTVALHLTDTAHELAVGHCLRLQVSSGDHPVHVRNLGTSENLPRATAMACSTVQIVSRPGVVSQLLLRQRVYPDVQARKASTSPCARIGRVSNG